MRSCARFFFYWLKSIDEGVKIWYNIGIIKKECIMEHLVDWNCRLLPEMRGLVSDSNESIEAMRMLYERFGFTHFHLMPEYDCTREPVSIFMLRYDRAIKKLQANVNLKEFHIRFHPCVMMAQDLHLTEGLEKLLIKNGNYLHIHLPISEYADWIDFEINRLLYKRNFNLWFTSFEQCVLLYPSEVLERLLNIKGSVYQFAFKSLSNPKVAQAIKKLVKSNRTVLLGTAVDCLERAYQFDYTFYEEQAASLLTPAVYQTVLRQNRYFWTKQRRFY